MWISGRTDGRTEDWGGRGEEVGEGEEEEEGCGYGGGVGQKE